MINQKDIRHQSNCFCRTKIPRFVFVSKSYCKRDIECANAQNKKSFLLTDHEWSTLSLDYLEFSLFYTLERIWVLRSWAKRILWGFSERESRWNNWDELLQMVFSRLSDAALESVVYICDEYTYIGAFFCFFLVVFWLWIFEYWRTVGNSCALYCKCDD